MKMGRATKAWQPCILPLWPSLGLSSPLWVSLILSLAFSGSLWVLSGPIWPSLALYGHLWLSLALSGSLWVSLGLSGSLWVSLGLSGSLWVYAQVHMLDLGLSLEGWRWWLPWPPCVTLSNTNGGGRCLWTDLWAAEEEEVVSSSAALRSSSPLGEGWRDEGMRSPELLLLLLTKTHTDTCPWGQRSWTQP